MWKKTCQWLNDDSSVARWQVKSFALGPVWSNQVHPILFNNIQVETQGTQGKCSWLPKYGFRLLRTRCGKSINDQIFTEGHIRVSMIFERGVGHSIIR